MGLMSRYYKPTASDAEKWLSLATIALKVSEKGHGYDELVRLAKRTGQVVVFGHNSRENACVRLREIALMRSQVPSTLLAMADLARQVTNMHQKWVEVENAMRGGQ